MCIKQKHKITASNPLKVNDILHNIHFLSSNNIIEKKINNK